MDYALDQRWPWLQNRAMATIVKLNTCTDEALADCIARRDAGADDWHDAQEAFRELYERHSRALLAFLSSRVKRSDLEDIHQDVWRRIWQFLPEGFKGGNFRAWLYQIARHHVIDVSRKKSAGSMNEEIEPIDPRGQQPVALLIEQELQQTLKRCLDKLTRELAELVQARLGGEAYPEICQRTGLKPERAHKLFHQAKEQLQACVDRANP